MHPADPNQFAMPKVVLAGRQPQQERIPMHSCPKPAHGRDGLGMQDKQPKWGGNEVLPTLLLMEQLV